MRALWRRFRAFFELTDEDRQYIERLKARLAEEDKK